MAYIFLIIMLIIGCILDNYFGVKSPAFYFFFGSFSMGIAIALIQRK